MNIKTFVPLWVLQLFCVVTPIFSQEIKTAEQSKNTISQNISDAYSFSTEQKDSSLNAIQSGACITNYSEQTVSSTITVVGCSDLEVQNVVITNTGNLTFSVPNNVIITGTFEVNTGGVFQSISQTTLKYNYDASGNRISRYID